MGREQIGNILCVVVYLQTGSIGWERWRPINTRWQMCTRDRRDADRATAM